MYNYQKTIASLFIIIKVFSCVIALFFPCPLIFSLCVFSEFYSLASTFGANQALWTFLFFAIGITWIIVTPVFIFSRSKNKDIISLLLIIVLTVWDVTCIVFSLAFNDFNNSLIIGLIFQILLILVSIITLISISKNFNYY